MQAAVMLTSFKYFDENLDSRINVSNYYSRNLRGYVECPMPNEDGNINCTFFDYTIVAEERDNLKNFLAKKGIETKIRHSILMPNQPAYDYLPKYNIPVAENLVDKILSLPIHEKLDIDDLKYVVEKIKEFYDSK